jgi:hypothetical protein
MPLLKLLVLFWLARKFYSCPTSNAFIIFGVLGGQTRCGNFRFGNVIVRGNGSWSLELDVGFIILNILDGILVISLCLCQFMFLVLMLPRQLRQASPPTSQQQLICFGRFDPIPMVSAKNSGTVTASVDLPPPTALDPISNLAVSSGPLVSAPYGPSVVQDRSSALLAREEIVDGLASLVEA